jgi:hypothetical protein
MAKFEAWVAKVYCEAWLWFRVMHGWISFRVMLWVAKVYGEGVGGYGLG